MPEVLYDDTIAAIATPIGEGGLSVIRVSGEHAFSVLEKVFKPAKRIEVEDMQSHTIHFGKMIQGEQVLDEVLVSIFRNPTSFTGQDVVEISCHGGIAVTKTLLQLILDQGVRSAEPGEFTKRAFLNGKLDLTQAEAVLEMIHSKSRGAVETAARQLTGALSTRFQSIKNRLMKLYAHMEAFLDFPEDDLEIYEDQKIQETLKEVEKELQELLQSFQRGSLLREGFILTLIGKPNVGKSSLFNALLERDRALVSSIPGTTRDHLEEYLEISGQLIRLVDTAGIHEDLKNPLDQIGMERTQKALSEAHGFLFVLDGSLKWDSEDEKVSELLPKSKPGICIINKSDLEQHIGDLKALKERMPEMECVEISSISREGFSNLEQAIEKLVASPDAEQEGEQVTRLRHHQSLKESLEAIQRTQEAFENRVSLDCVTMELKSSIDVLRELVGEIYSEDLLDVIFSEFCIGK